MAACASDDVHADDDGHAGALNVYAGADWRLMAAVWIDFERVEFEIELEFELEFLA